ncbi:unnamed protein product [Cyclocybe aegerita]|uniref:Hydrophobin n=1 Tax=Cyclocybe aegerita TaxID=1973307 RepID=A0A8S0XZF3_CYCAE|nr:unnamed protein product [Cyclocybe aegerita]
MAREALLLYIRKRTAHILQSKAHKHPINSTKSTHNAIPHCSCSSRSHSPCCRHNDSHGHHSFSSASDPDGPQSMRNWSHSVLQLSSGPNAPGGLLGLPILGPLLGILGLVINPINAIVGVTCSPIDVIGIGGNSCSAQPVCCQNNSFNGIIAIGCTPVNLNL